MSSIFKHELSHIFARLRRLLEHHLDRDLLVETAMEAEPHLAHAPHPDQMLESNAGDLYRCRSHYRLRPVPKHRLQRSARIPLHSGHTILPTPLHSGHCLTSGGFRLEDRL